MRNFFFRTCFIALLAIISGNVNSQTSWTASYVQEGNFVLYNVGSGQYFTRGNGWTTQASITESGNQADALRLQLEAVGSNFKIRTDVNGSGCGVEHLSGGTIYTDQSRNKQSTWTFTQVGTDNGPIYTIMSADNHGGGAGKYMSANSSNTIVDPVDDASSDYAKWKLLQVKSAQETADDAVAAKSATLAALPSATPSSPIDATPVIFDANFDNELLQSYWTVETTNSNLQGGSSSNPCAESWRAAFTISQTITGLPEGTYVLKAQAALTDYAGLYNGADYPVVYANEVTTPFIDMEEADRGTSMDKLSGSFTAGKYEVAPITVVVGEDGVLTVGVKGTRTDTWAIWDNFRLTFYGFDQSALVVAYQNALAEAQGIEGVMSKSAAQELADAISTYNSVDESSNDALSTALNALKTAIANAKHSIEDYKAIANELDNIPNGSCKTTLINKYQQGDFASLDDFYVQLRSVILGGLGSDDNVDITAVILNHTPTANADHWTVKKEDGTVGSVYYFDITYNCAEFWNQSGYSIEQTIPGLPEGSYELYCTAFTRDGMTATLSVSGGASASVNLVTIPSSTANSRYQANTYFNGGGGQNVLTFNIVGTPKDVTIKLKADDTSGDHWTVWRNFSLTYHGYSLDLAKTRLAEAVAAAEATEGSIPPAAYAAISAVVTRYNKTYDDVNDYITAIASINDAINTYASADIISSCSRYLKTHNDIIRARHTEGLGEKEDGTFATFDNTISNIEDQFNTTTSATELDALVEQLQSALKALLSGVRPSSNYPIDITPLLNNPDFEERAEPNTGILPGWNCTFIRGTTATNIGWQEHAYNSNGATSAQGDAYVNGDIRVEHVIEAWQSNSSPYIIGDGELYQRLSGLPVGKYRLSTDAIAANQWIETNNPVNGVYIYIKSGLLETRTEIHTGNGLPEHFEIDFLCDYADYLDFGLKTINTTANWIVADNFHIYFLEALDESPGVTALKDALNLYDSIIINACSKTVRLAFETALDDARAMVQTDIYSAAHSEECIAQITLLSNALSAVQSSEEEYAGFQQQIQSCLARKDVEWDDSPVRPALDELAAELQTSINVGTATNDDFSRLSTRADSIVTYWNTHLLPEEQQHLNNVALTNGCTLDDFIIKSGFVTTINLSNRGIDGMFALSAFNDGMPHLQNIDLSNNSISSVDATLPSSIQVNLRNQVFSNVITLDLPNVDDETLPSQLPPIFMYNSDDGGYTGKYTIYANGDGWEMAFENINHGFINLIYNYGFTYRGESGDTIIFENYYGDANGSTIPLRLTFEQGDASFNGIIDISDLTLIINYILNALPEDFIFNYSAADLFKDNKINVQDIVKEVDLLLNQTAAQNIKPRRVSKHTLERYSEASAKMYFSEGNLILDTTTPISALDIVINTHSPISLDAINALGFTTVTRTFADGIHIIAYSMSGANIPIGKTMIATSDDYSAIIIAATLADKTSKSISPELNSSITTGISEYADAFKTDQEDVIYNLSGQRMSLHSLPQGIYIHNGRKLKK